MFSFSLLQLLLHPILDIVVDAELESDGFGHGSLLHPRQCIAHGMSVTSESLPRFSLVTGLLHFSSDLSK